MGAFATEELSRQKVLELNDFKSQNLIDAFVKNVGPESSEKVAINAKVFAHSLLEIGFGDEITPTIKATLSVWVASKSLKGVITEEKIKSISEQQLCVYFDIAQGSMRKQLGKLKKFLNENNPGTIHKEAWQVFEGAISLAKASIIKGILR